MCILPVTRTDKTQSPYIPGAQIPTVEARQEPKISRSVGPAVVMTTKVEPHTLRVRIPTVEARQEHIEVAAVEDLEAVHTRVRIPDRQELIGIA